MNLGIRATIGGMYRSMSSRLEILALEPFFGGSRRAMLEAIMRGSRHQWTLMKLPARRMERRLEAAAQWFAEQMSRHDFGKADVVFTSEALNLFELQRLVPRLARRPAVVYFHDNQLPEPHEIQAEWFESRRQNFNQPTDDEGDAGEWLSGWPTEPNEPAPQFAAARDSASADTCATSTRRR